MNHPENIISRYKAVIALAERGTTDGEKAAANNAAEQMRAKFPGIHEQAFPPKHTRSAPPRGGGFNPSPPEPESVPWYERFAGGQFRKTASEAFDWAARVAAEMASLEYARKAAEELTELQTKMLAKERVQIAVKIPLREMYYFSERFSEQQKAEFAARIAAAVEDEVLRIMNEEG
jgi:phenylpyruvate tautomerase PptA (4-oxalocrotonate tautomerase family)